MLAWASKICWTRSTMVTDSVYECIFFSVQKIDNLTTHGLGSCGKHGRRAGRIFYREGYLTCAGFGNPTQA